MNRVVLVATAMALSVGLAACETKQQRVANKEDMLAAAGITTTAIIYYRYLSFAMNMPVC